MFKILLFVVSIIGLYGCYIKTQSDKFTNVSEADVLLCKFADCNGCDYWALTHFLLYLILGYLYPNRLFVLLHLFH
jgi:hypothetical protein